MQGARDAKDAVVDKAGQVKDGIVQGYKDTKEAVKDGVITGAATVMAAGEVTVDAAKRVGKSIKDRTISGAKTIQGKYRDAKGNLLSRIAAAKEMAKEKWGQLKERAGEVKDGVVQGYRDTKDAIGERVTEVRDNVVEKAGQVKDGVVRTARNGAAIVVATSLLAKEGVEKGLEHGSEFMKTAAEVTKDKIEAVRDNITERTSSAKMNVKGFFAKSVQSLLDRITDSMSKDNEAYMAAKGRNEARKEAKEQDKNSKDTDGGPEL